jgi:hypothetical protein
MFDLKRTGSQRSILGRLRPITRFSRSVLEQEHFVYSGGTRKTLRLFRLRSTPAFACLFCDWFIVLPAISSFANAGLSCLSNSIVSSRWILEAGERDANFRLHANVRYLDRYQFIPKSAPYAIHQWIMSGQGARGRPRYPDSRCKHHRGLVATITVTPENLLTAYQATGRSGSGTRWNQVREP